MNKTQKPFVNCVACHKEIDRRTDKYAIVTGKKIVPRKYACSDCMDKPVLVYWMAPNNDLKRCMDRIAAAHRLNWKKFPRGREVQEVRFGTRLILGLMKEAGEV